MQENVAKNPYLALREAKIQRNQARLKDLGLLQNPSRRRTETLPRSSKPLPKKKASRPTRRSTRNRSASTPTENVVESSAPSQVKRAIRQDPRDPTRSTTVAALHDIGEQYQPDHSTAHAYPRSASPQSARSLHVKLDRLVQAMLGRVMPNTGKAYCMEASAQVAVDGYHGGAISFNKYSGVQEWGNDVLFLWINLDNPQAEVLNEFLQDGRQVTWFGGSRMHDQTPVIQKLIKIGKRSSPLDRSGIVLWCRRYEHETKGFSPYVCLGRLSYDSHQPGSSPLAFVWNLHDYQALLSQSAFRNLVGLDDDCNNFESTPHASSK